MARRKRPSQRRLIKRYNWKLKGLTFTDRLTLSLTKFPTLDVPEDWGKGEANEEKNK